jgi:hypothetical protein
MFGIRHLLLFAFCSDLSPQQMQILDSVFCPCRSTQVGPDHHSKSIDFDHEIMENEKSSDFDHEIMNLVEKNVGTPAILGRALGLVSVLGDKGVTLWNLGDVTFEIKDKHGFQEFKSAIVEKIGRLLSWFLHQPPNATYER